MEEEIITPEEETFEYNKLRYILDKNGYVCHASLGGLIVCDLGECTEYKGEVPDDYETIEEWYDTQISEKKLNAWKIVEGNLVYDENKYIELQAQYEQEAIDNACVKHKELYGLKKEIEDIQDVNNSQYTEASASGKLITIDNVKKVYPRVKLTNINPYSFNKVDLIVSNKNLLPNTALGQTINEVEFTPNEDRSITINGTSTANIEYNIAGANSNISPILAFKKDKDYYLSGVDLGNNTSNLPIEYQRVDYIQSNGNQYINTGFKPNQDTKIEVVASTYVKKSAAQFIFGSRNSARTTSFNGFLWTEYGAFYSGYGNSNNVNSNTQYKADTKYKVVLDKNLYYVDDVLLTTHTEQTFTSDYEITLFTLNNNGAYDTSQGLQGKIYSCKIYDNGTLVRNLIPCYRVSDNVIGMYDLVNDVFYENVGSGTFTKGNDIKDASLKMYNYDGTDRTEVYSGNGGLIKFTDDDKPITQIVLSIPTGTTIEDLTIYPQLELGSSESDYVEHQSSKLTIDFSEYIKDGLFPSETLFPSDTLFPYGTTISYILIENGKAYIKVDETEEEIEIEQVHLLSGYNIIYTAQDTNIDITYCIDELKVDDLSFLQGKSTTTNKFKILEDGSIEAHNGYFSGDIYLDTGSKVIGGDGLLTNLQFQSASGNTPLGWFYDYQEYRKMGIDITYSIPSNFTIKQAYITLFHVPCYTSLTTESGTSYYWGYSRAVKLYKMKNTNLYFEKIDPSAIPYYADMTNVSEISEAFGSSGFTAKTASSSSHNAEYKNTIDISSSFTSGENGMLIIKTSASTPSSHADSLKKTGQAFAVLNIIGYMNYE